MTTEAGAAEPGAKAKEPSFDFSKVPAHADQPSALPKSSEATRHETFGAWKLEGAVTLESTSELFAKVQAHVKASGAKLNTNKNSGGMEVERNSPLCIHGHSGSGLTTIMAHVCNQVGTSVPGAVVISRFLGTTTNSSTPRALLISLCREIYQVYKNQVPELPQDYHNLMIAFTDMLALVDEDKMQRPLVIVLDSVHELEDRNNAHGMAWLPKDLPKNCSILLSAIEKPGREADAQGGEELVVEEDVSFGAQLLQSDRSSTLGRCLLNLSNSFGGALPAENLLEVPQLGEGDGKT
jgi:hypothetical protein